MNSGEYDFAIIGAGVAGLSAAIYAGRYKMKAVVIDNQLGGYTAIAGEIKNYPGYPSIDGYELVKNMKEQALQYGIEFYGERVTGVLKKQHCFHVATMGKSFEAHALLLSIGAKRRELGLPKEKELTGRGVHYCITCDGLVYSGKIIGIVGGGDTAVKGVIQASEYANQVIMIVREKEIVAEPVNFEQFKKLGDKVKVLYETEVKELQGDKVLTGVRLSKMHGGTNELSLDALFVEIGVAPDATLPKSLGVALDEKGYVKVDTMMRTNVDGIFAAGDITNFFGCFKQDITAAAMGTVAATTAYEDHKKHGELCSCHALPQQIKRL